jgi:hypothetical protein
MTTLKEVLFFPSSFSHFFPQLKMQFDAGKLPLDPIIDAIFHSPVVAPATR